VEIKNDRLVLGEQGIKVAIRKTVRMFRVGLQPVEIDHVDKTNLQIGKVLAQDGNRGQRLLGQNIARARHHHVRFCPVVGAGPLPDSNPLGAVNHCFIHIQIGKVRLLVGHNHVHVILAAQAVVCHAQ